jgi:hypothetical protein
VASDASLILRILNIKGFSLFIIILFKSLKISDASDAKSILALKINVFWRRICKIYLTPI